MQKVTIQTYDPDVVGTNGIFNQQYNLAQSVPDATTTTDTAGKEHIRKSVKSFGKGKKISKFVKLLNNVNIFTAAKKFLTALPFRIWSFFIESFLVHHYRPEWGKYITWNHRVPPSTKKRKKRKSLRLSSKKRKSRMSRATMTGICPKMASHDHSECEIVRINVSGQIFEPQIRTLNQFPSTLLGDPRRMLSYYDPDRDEFFFDRHRTSFEAILYYFQTGGIIRRPSAVSLDCFLEEVKFYDLGQKIVSILENNEGIGIEEEKALPKNLLKRKLWLLFEYPESSYQSRIMAYFSILLVCISVFEFCIETMPIFRVPNILRLNSSVILGNNSEDTAGSYELGDPFFCVETLCIIFFTFEYTMRLITCPQLFAFIKDLANLIDLIAILPYFLNLLYIIPADSGGKTSKTASLTLLRIIRLVRVFRILKLSRHNRGLKILGKTLRASIRELGLLMFFLFIGIVVFSSAIYFADYISPSSPFESIPSAFWFSVVTMTTLGYGDMVPKGAFGKIVGSLCAISGVLTISLPVPVIVSNFNTFYNREEMHKDPNAVKVKFDHVAHCPFLPGWYKQDGYPVEEKSGSVRWETRNSSSRRWLIRDQIPDRSDSDFEGLKVKIDERYSKSKTTIRSTKRQRKKVTRSWFSR